MNKTIRNLSKFLIITLISVHASNTSSEATEKPTLTNGTRGNQPKAQLPFRSECFF